MRFRNMRIATVAVLLTVLVLPGAAGATTQVVEVSVIGADTLAIDVEEEFGLGVLVPGATSERGFWMGITNTTSGGWEVYVEATDLTSFWHDCDEFGNCTRVDTDPLYTIDAGNLYMRGGDQDDWGDSAAITAYEGNLVGAATAFLLMEGTSVAYGSFNVDNPQPSVELTVPGTADVADYYTTLTYTIMAP